MQKRELLTILYFFLTIYSFGGGAVQGIANYSSWKLIGADDFPAVHKYVNRRIFLVYVPFFFLSVLTNIARSLTFLSGSSHLRWPSQFTSNWMTLSPTN